MLELNPGLILWTIVTFVIVLMILRWTAWKPLLAAMAALSAALRAPLVLREVYGYEYAEIAALLAILGPALTRVIGGPASRPRLHVLGGRREHPAPDLA